MGIALLSLLLFGLLLPGAAHAAKKRVLFQLSNLQQWADLNYLYTGRKYTADQGAKRTSGSHEFEETYHLEIDYAILSSNLLNGALELDLGLLQNLESETAAVDRSGSASGFGLDFLLDGTFFEQRPYPVTFSASRSTQRVSAPFSPRYDLTSSIYGTGLNLKNRRVPVQLFYRYFESETSGLKIDRLQTSSDLSLDATYEYHDFSRTSLGMRTTSSSAEFAGSSAAIKTDRYSLEGRNTLNWTAREQPNSLDSSYQLQRDWGVSEKRTVQWDESLTLQLGKALRTGASYGYGKNEASEQDRQTERQRAWATHQLFKSLTTRVDYSAAQSDYDSGTQKNWQGLFNVAYTKELPKKSRLNLSYGYAYGEIDTALVDQQLYVFGERVTVNLSGDNYLENLEVIEVIRVVDEDGIPVPDGSYTVEPFGLRTRLDFSGSGIPDGTPLFVDYTYRINNSIEFATTTHSVSASLGLFDNRYRLYGNFSVSAQELLSGSDNVSPLTQQTMSQLGVEASLEKYTLSANYMHLQSTLSTDTSWEAFANYTNDLGRGLLNLRLSERYSVTEQHEGLDGNGSRSEGRNSISLFADYRMRLIYNSTLSLRGRLLDMRGQRDQNDISFGTTLETRWRRFELRLMADAIWQLYEQSTSQELLFSLLLRRYF